MIENLESTINPGEQIGQYRVGAAIAQSRLATVYRATNLRDGREVALKVPHPDVEKDQNLADWFRRQREIGESLDHPGIIKVIPEQNGGGDYLAMEWFEGKTLREILDTEKRLPAERALAIAREVSEALEYMHGRGVVHHDLQPENILVGAGDHIKLIDFGGAAKTQARRLTFTKVAQLAGTSNYVSPEELLGKQTDARSDLYALGMILYEMLTGAKPFPQEDPYERITSYPVPPREVDPAISPQLQEIIYRALEREPKNRYANARDFARDLMQPDRVGVADRPELKNWRKGNRTGWKKYAPYSLLVLIPIAIFLLLLFLARQ